MTGHNPLSGLTKYVEVEAKNQHISEDKAFLLWYAKVRAPNHKINYTDRKDGGIDLVLEGEKNIILIQGKYGKGSSNDLKVFRDSLKQWEQKETFVRWLKEVKNEAAKIVYRDVYKYFNKKKFIWEFVSLKKYDKKKKNFLSPSDTVFFSSRIVSPEDLEFYYSLYAIGSAYTDTLTIDLEEDGFSFEDPDNRGYNTNICIMKIPSLLKAIRYVDDEKLLFSRNVRLDIPNSKVNESIKKTYEDETDNFFYGNNGIHILCTKATFEGKTVEITQPAIINGGQTVRTLLKSDDRGGAILARITSIPQHKQTEKYMSRFLDDIIFRSNNNNRMMPWDLRSNDKIQVEIARELYERGIFYERKERQWNLEKTKWEAQFNFHINSVVVAQIMAICDKSIGPARLKQEGRERLFEKKDEGGYYEKLFNRLISNMDESESKIRIYELVRKNVKRASKIPQQYRTFNKAAINYVFGVMWRLIEKKSPKHPLLLRNPRVFYPIISGMTCSLFEEYRSDLEKGKISQNDIFRTENYWIKAVNRLKSWRIKVHKVLD